MNVPLPFITARSHRKVTRSAKREPAARSIIHIRGGDGKEPSMNSARRRASAAKIAGAINRLALMSLAILLPFLAVAAPAVIVVKVLSDLTWGR